MAVAIQEALVAGDMQEASAGIEELIEALSRSDKRVLESHLIQLMKHILKWQAQPERRSRSWVATIHNARKHIRKLQIDTPRFTDRLIQEQLWDDCLDSAHYEAAGEINRDMPWTTLSWEEVFERPYTLTP
jgi:hypothetical protein